MASDYISNSEFNKILEFITVNTKYNPIKFSDPTESMKRVQDEINAGMEERAKEGKVTVNNFIEACCKYTYATFRMGICTPGRYNETSQYQADYEELDLDRKRAHNELIKKMSVIQREALRLTRANGTKAYPNGICPEFPEEYVDRVEDLLDSSPKIDGASQTRMVSGKEREIRHKIADWCWNFVSMCIADPEEDIQFSYDMNLADVAKINKVVQKLGVRGMKKKIDDIAFYER